MSGGSYDYLYLNAHELGGYREHLEAMAVRLEGLPHATNAAGATRRILAALDDEVLTEVWRAIEWWDSGDFGEEEARAAIAKYEEQQDRG